MPIDSGLSRTATRPPRGRQPGRQRERVQALGGTLAAGDLPAGGFHLALSLPAAQAGT